MINFRKFNILLVVLMTSLCIFSITFAHAETEANIDQKITALEKSLAELEKMTSSSKYESLRSLIESVKMEYKFALNDMKFVREQLALKDIQVNKVKDSIRDRELLLATNEQTIRNLKKEIEDLSKNSKAPKVQAPEQVDNRKSYDQQIVLLKDKVRELNEKSSEKVNKAKAPLLDRIKNLEMSLKEYEELVPRMKKENKEIYAEMNKTKKKNEDLENQVGIFSEKLEIAEAFNSEKLIRDKQRAEDELAMVQSRLQKAQDQAALHASNARALEEDLEGRSKEMATLIKERTEANKEANDFRLQLEKRAGNSNKDIEKVRSELQSKIDRYVKELSEADEKIKSKDALIKEKDKQLSTVQKEQKELMKKYNKSHGPLEEKLSKAENKLQDKMTEANLLKAELKEAEKELAALNKEKLLFDKKLSKLERSKEEAVSSLNKYKQVQKEKGDRLAEYQKMADYSEEAFQKLKKKLDKVSNDL